MKSEKSQVEVMVVTEAVGHTFEGLDFVVDSFHGFGGNRHVEIGEDAVLVGFDGAGEFRQFGDVGRSGGGEPGVELEGGGMF